MAEESGSCPSTKATVPSLRIVDTSVNTSRCSSMVQKQLASTATTITTTTTNSSINNNNQQHQQQQQPTAATARMILHGCEPLPSVMPIMFIAWRVRWKVSSSDTSCKKKKQVRSCATLCPALSSLLYPPSPLFLSASLYHLLLSVWLKLSFLLHIPPHRCIQNDSHSRTRPHHASCTTVFPPLWLL